MQQKTIRIVAILSAAVLTAPLHAATLLTRFATDPLASGWQVHGNTNLFAWDATNQNLRVTWDSSQPNSYFHHPLGQTLTRTNGFVLAFDLNLTDMPDANGFQLALGLLKFADATNAGFFRGSGFQSPNLAEFDYFPDTGYGASFNGTMADAAGTFTFQYAKEPMAFGTTYRIILTHTPGSQFIGGQVLTNDQLYTTLSLAYASPGFADFQLDTVAVCSYSHVNGYGNSILAHGTVDNITIASPLPVATVAQPAANQVAFLSDANWLYTLEASTNLTAWTAVSTTTPGNGDPLVLQDTNAPASRVLYRVRANLP